METRRKMKNRAYILAILALIMLVAVGYAILNANLKINGTTKISKSAWDIHFENITPSTRGVSPTQAPTIDSSRTGISFAVNLSNLGDFYEFYVDLVNSGNFDAKLESINTTNLTEEQKKYLDLEISYSDGAAINIGDTIRSLKKDTIKVMVQYKTDPLILPEVTTLDFNVSLVFVQDDGTGEDRSGNVLYNVLKDNAVMDNIASEFVKSETGINLGAISSDTNGKGVYTLAKTANNANPIYYYRGNVTNNNVLFGGYCWKMIRTTDTGGIKMIYNGLPSAGSCNNTGNDTLVENSTYNNQSNPGYTYDDGSGNQVDSAIKAKIDDWFTNASALNKYLSYLEDTPFYNERDSVLGGGGDIAGAFGPRMRIWGNSKENYVENVSKTNVILGAFNNEDKYTTSISNGNGLLKYQIGLITTDEVVLAGGRGYISSRDTGSNNSYYLYSNSNYWTMSPLYMSQTNSNNIAIVDNLGTINELAWDSSSGIRPVISLKSGITYTEGDGTSNSPYLITPYDIEKDSHHLYNMIRLNSVPDNVASEYVTGTNKDGQPGIHFGKISSGSNGKGIYELTQTKEDGETIYYYRGSVTNNNVEFGGFCWKIIRTSSTKGVKLIYNGTKQADGCTATGSAATIGNTYYHNLNDALMYVGYTYSNPFKTDSGIKRIIDNWFTSNLIDYSNYLEDTPFYNERDNAVATDESNYNLFAPYIRMYGQVYNKKSTINTTIKLGVTRDNDRYTVSAGNGNGELLYKVGAITSDEVVLAGGRGFISAEDSGANTNYYLYIGAEYLTISPYFSSQYARVYKVGKNGYLEGSIVSSYSLSRPVVSLKPGTVYTTGDGTTSNPYVIATT